MQIAHVGPKTLSDLIRLDPLLAGATERNCIATARQPKKMRLESTECNEILF